MHYTIYCIYNKMNAKRKIISVDEQTYLALKQLGMAGDSFNDVLSKMLKDAHFQKGSKMEES
jgi:predicted CopG family antitoxin